MQRFMRLLMVMAVLWCGVHTAVPASAMTEGAPTEASAHADHGFETSRDRPGESDKPDQVSHNHCPMAPDQPIAAAVGKPLTLKGPVFALPVQTLSSRSQAPALEPPAA